jgi:hypothetical protein
VSLSSLAEAAPLGMVSYSTAKRRTPKQALAAEQIASCAGMF